MNLDLSELRARSPFIAERAHPTLPLLIWNYTAKCQYEKAWDAFTLLARGLVTTPEGEVIGRGMEKFFNVGERPETQIENLPVAPHRIYEKLDGSLILMTRYQGGMEVWSRGSFESRQARWAQAWLKKQGVTPDRLLSGHTYCLEALYAENKIVVDYGKEEGLFLLAVISNENGHELDPHREAPYLNVRAVKRYDWDLSHLERQVTRLSANQEGFVVHFPEQGLRVKMKGAEYTRLHRLITGFSTTALWECLAAGQDLEAMLERVPDEFYQWVKRQKLSLERQFAMHHLEAINALEKVQGLPDRKAQALYLKGHHPEAMPLVFMLMDGKDPAPMIWKKIRPVWSLPFKAEEE